MWQGYDNKGCIKGNPVKELKDALLNARNSEVLAVELQNLALDSYEYSALVNSVRILEEIAAYHCKCSTTPKCKTCLAREYIEALSRMADKGVECVK